MIPSTLRMKNFFSHKDSEIDFSDFGSALLIGNTEGDYNKSNGSGKSAIFEAVLWCLFNKSRASMMDDIIRWGEKTCSVELEFFHNGEKYLVTRVRNRVSSTSTVEFFLMNGEGEWVNISCSTSGDTNLKIEELIKLDYKTFVNSVYFRQNDISEFAESEPSKKKEILKSIVDISRWDDYEKAAKKKSRDVKVECKVLNGAIADLEQTIQKLSEAEGEISKAESQSIAYKAELDSIQSQISSVEAKYLSIKKSLDTDTYDRVIADIDRLNKEEASASLRKDSAEKALLKSRGEKDEIDESISTLSSKVEGLEVQPIDEGSYETLREELTNYKSKIDSSKNALRDLADIQVLAGECYTCNQPISDELHASLLCSHNEKKEMYEERLLVSKQGLIKAEQALEVFLSSKKNNDFINSVTSEIDTLKFKRSVISESLKRAEKELSSAANDLSNISFELKSNNEILESIKNEDFQALRLKLKKHNMAKDSLTEKISENDKLIGRLGERRSVLAERVSKMRLDKAKITKKLKKAALFEKLGKLFGKSGIQTILLDFVIEDLERTANTILGSICNEPSVIVLETQRVGADGVSIIETLDLKVRKDGHLQNFKSLSGGEKFRISLALRVALSDISSRYGGSSLEFLLLDEVNSPLDRYGVETLFVNVIKSLEDKYKILVITHDESLKEKFDNVINVTKINGESEVEFSKR